MTEHEVDVGVCALHRLLLAAGTLSTSAGEGPAVVVGESEGGEALQVDGGGALADSDAVAFDASVADFAPAARKARR
jgi:hypothetical protein